MLLGQRRGRGSRARRACRRSPRSIARCGPTRAACGAISRSQNSRAVARISCCSSESSKSTGDPIDTTKYPAEPVALSSTSPTGRLWLAPSTVTRWGFDLLALRAQRDAAIVRRTRAPAQVGARTKTPLIPRFARRPAGARRVEVPRDVCLSQDADEPAVLLDDGQPATWCSAINRNASSMSCCGSTVARLCGRDLGDLRRVELPSLGDDAQRDVAIGHDADEPGRPRRSGRTRPRPRSASPLPRPPRRHPAAPAGALCHQLTNLGHVTPPFRAPSPRGPARANLGGSMSSIARMACQILQQVDH